eukprot:jgi/Chlat1/6563/Chrsp45S05927
MVAGLSLGVAAVAVPKVACAPKATSSGRQPTRCSAERPAVDRRSFVKALAFIPLTAALAQEAKAESLLDRLKNAFNPQSDKVAEGEDLRKSVAKIGKKTEEAVVGDAVTPQVGEPGADNSAPGIPDPAIPDEPEKKNK